MSQEELTELANSAAHWCEEEYHRRKERDAARAEVKRLQKLLGRAHSYISRSRQDREAATLLDEIDRALEDQP